MVIFENYQKVSQWFCSSTLNKKDQEVYREDNGNFL